MVLFFFLNSQPYCGCVVCVCVCISMCICGFWFTSSLSYKSCRQSPSLMIPFVFQQCGGRERERDGEQEGEPGKESQIFMSLTLLSEMKP